MSKNKSAFETLSQGPITMISTAGKENIQSRGVETVKIKIRMNNEIKLLTLTDVLYVLELRNNLLSVPAITRKDYTVEFSKKIANVIRPNGSLLVKAIKKDNMYVIKQVECDKVYSVSPDENSKLKLWHARYGHLNYKDLRGLSNKERVYGLDIPMKDRGMSCDVCNKSKIHTLPFAEGTRAKNILELVHTDICGPMSVKSYGNARYFVTFIDDATRYIVVVMLKSRSEVLTEFKKFQLRVEKETGRKIIKLRSDNAKEYVSKEFNSYIESQGITRQLSVAHTPQQNGVPERANKTIVEMARVMLIQSNVPRELWAEAVNTAVFIRNRCPSRANNGFTPYELWSERKPNVKFFRIFGSQATFLRKGPY